LSLHGRTKLNTDEPKNINSGVEQMKKETFTPRNGITLLLVIVVVSMMIASLALSFPFRLDVLPDKGENFGCGTCHINPAGGGERNEFGQDYARIAVPAGDQYTDELAQLDSDGDEFTNQEEFDAKLPTNPGDADSHPEEKPKPASVKPKGKIGTTWGKMKTGR
jgi:hypothetical protein